jgi:DNA-binding NarL/FixJ family response regulator
MSPEQSDLSVVIIEDHSIFVEGLCSVLQNVAGIFIAGTFMEGAPALDFIQNNRVDVVFLDISLPDVSGIDVCHAIKLIKPSIKVIALTNHTEKSVVTAMLQHGASGYLLKNTSKKDLVNAIFQVRDDQLSINGEVQGILFSPSSPPAEIPRLTKREKEVLQLVSEGATTAGIATQLFISPQTVETHRKNLMQKLKVNNAAALIRKAVEHRLLKD